MNVNKSELLTLHTTLSQRALEIMAQKNQDYTGGSEDPFANFRASVVLGIEPEVGLMNRMIDKFQRAKSFIAHGNLAVVDEGIWDIGHDLINYSVLLTGLLLEREEAQKQANGPAIATAEPEVPVLRRKRSITDPRTGQLIYLSNASQSLLGDIIKDNSGTYSDEIQSLASAALRKKKRISKRATKARRGSIEGPAGGWN